MASLVTAAREHWPVYLMEAAELAAFMLSACAFVVLFEHPASPARQALNDSFLRRALMGLAMGATAVAIVYSPWGRRSGAHFNPCVTLAFYRLGKVPGADAAAYIVAQFVGGAAGVGIAAALLGGLLADPAVSYAATAPGTGGTSVAFAAELAISFALMTAVLGAASRPRIAPFTGVVAGALVAAYITVEAPLSGMSMNPARTVASALFAGRWTALWIYFVAPAAGMLGAAEAYVRAGRLRALRCAKLNHDERTRCIFCIAAAAAPLPARAEVFECQIDATT
jgi:aquaporin Z